MKLETRLADLCQSGDHRLAMELARGALQRATLIDTTVVAGMLRIETEQFVGEHPIEKQDGDITFGEGTYEWKGGDLSLSVTRREVLSTVSDTDISAALAESDTDWSAEPSTPQSPTDKRQQRIKRSI